MPSPFPGMNPYLEQDDVWEDFHNSYIVHCRDMLAASVGANYYVKVEQQLYIHEIAAPERSFLGKSDVGVSAEPGTESAGGSVTMLAAPVVGIIPMATETERHLSLEIRDKRDREVVTVLEMLSPSNKRKAADREAYLAKRLHVLTSGVHLVELDLLRGGPRLPLERLPDCAYYVLVSRAAERPRVGLWPLRLADRLPKVPVPLRDPEAAVPLDLQDVLDRVYDAARYGSYIYRDTPQPPLSEAEAAWARQFVPSVIP